MDLSSIFQRINVRHFDGFLDPPHLVWNSRLRSSAGRFVPGSRKWIYQAPAKIEVASYLLEEARAAELIEDTLAHEMIHYWLWIRRKPYGHTPQFIEKMKEMGVSRYNTTPKLRPYRYVYRCGSCARDFPAKKRLGVLACANCCKAHSDGRFDIRFKLVLNRSLSRDEGLELSRQRLRLSECSA